MHPLPPYRLAVLGALATLPIPVTAQHRDALRAGPTSIPRVTAGEGRHSAAAPTVPIRRVGPVALRPVALQDSCAPGPFLLRLILEPPSGAVGGAGAGWLVFTFGVGALAADHGSEYRRTRRPFIRGGAVLGAAIGVHRLVTVPTCPRPAGAAI